MKIDNFSADWRSGKALCCFINSFKPGLISNWNNFDVSMATTTCEEALKIAEKELNVPKIIKGSEVTSKNLPEEVIVAYLSQYYNLNHENKKPIKETAKSLLYEDKLNFVLSGNFIKI